MTKKMIVVVGVLVVLGLMPIPYRQGEVVCKPCLPEMECDCPREGEIGWREPLIWQVLGVLSRTSMLRNERLK